MPDDVNPRNDTSSIVTPLSVDISYKKIQIEENRTDSCRVRAVIYNGGVIPYVNLLTLFATIDGKKIETTMPKYSWQLDPGHTIHRDFIDKNTGNIIKIPKKPNREYKGVGTMRQSNPDDNPSNDETTIIEVVNYFEGVPLAEDADFILEQNYPNPFDGTTRIEFFLPYGGKARFFVNDLVGRTLYESTAVYEQGRNTISFNKDGLSAGVYYYGIEYNGQRRMHKMIVK